MKHKVQSGGQFRLLHNVEYVLRDKNGNAKPLFTENKLGELLLRMFRKFVSNPIDAKTAQVKAGWLNHFAAYGVRINGLTGTWGMSRNLSNLVVSAGKAGAASRLGGAGSEALFDKIGQGVGTTSPVAGNTALETEKDASNGTTTTHAISAATNTRVTTTVTNDTAQSVGTINELATMAITESGLFNAGTGGTMLARQTFSAVNVVSGDSLQITWKIAFA